jgi:hypothetical protein
VCDIARLRRSGSLVETSPLIGLASLDWKRAFAPVQDVGTKQAFDYCPESTPAMRFPKFWKQVFNKSQSVSARGWSDNSFEEAEQNAQLRLERILSALKSNRKDALRRSYQYVIDNTICEFVIDQVLDEANGAQLGVISRNAYGALVLNTPRLMMVDIDCAEAKRNTGLLGLLFGKKPAGLKPEEDRIERLRQWQQQHPEYSFRVYRTAAGLRAIVPNRVIESINSSVLQIMEELDSDPLYRSLCRSQACFRARLTPKPWRVGINPPTQKFPFRNQQEESQFDVWFEQYVERSKSFRVCQLITTMGTQETTPITGQLIELHDRFCCGDERLELA